MKLSLALPLDLESPTRSFADLLGLTCEAAARFRGGRAQWLALRRELRAYMEQATDAGATAEQLGQLAETAAPVGSLWSPSRRKGGSRYQLSRWEHDGGTHGRSTVVFTAAASTVRQPPRRVVEAQEVLGDRSKWWRVT